MEKDFFDWVNEHFFEWIATTNNCTTDDYRLFMRTVMEHVIMAKIKDISRIDSEISKMNGWYVRVYGGGKTFSKYFSDCKYKSKTGALEAAKAYLEDLQREITEKFKDYNPSESKPKYRQKRHTANTSGVVGVHRSEFVSRGRKMAYWVATWSEDGKSKRKSFRFGTSSRNEVEAKSIAIQWRTQKIRELDRI